MNIAISKKKLSRLFALLMIIFFSMIINAFAQQNKLDLSGEWRVTLSNDSLPAEWKGKLNKSEGMIKLPSSLAQQGYGFKTEGSEFGVLTPEYKYLGVATFERTINIPKEWKQKQLEIYLERVLWESRVYIDGVEYGVQDALGTPHIHTLGTLSPGEHKLTIKVDNGMIHNIGDKGHAYGAYTQSIWNGIVGVMEVRAKDPAHINDVRIFCLPETDQLKLEVGFNSVKKEKLELKVAITRIDSKDVILERSFAVKAEAGKQQQELLLDLNGKLQKWTEFDPAVYKLSTTLKSKKYSDTLESEFGYMTVSHDGTHILVNGQPVFLRGNLDCVHFPLTGYPSTEVEDWVRIFKIYKDYGLNHARFHSWCPPEAAFKAANRVGIYLQAEASIWIDWWMGADMIERGRPEMDTKGKPKGLGKDPERDKFVIAEMNRVVDFYGNNPSFTMFCIGNELGNSDFEVMKTWVKDLKDKDPRRLYSVSTARNITEVDDYMATHYIPGVGRTRGLNGARTDWDFEDSYSKMNIPIIAHEIGQWPVFPTWKEIDKYKGVLKARNFEEFKAVAEKNGIADQDEIFKDVSGALNQMMYKYETESFLRTKSCAGVQLLSIQDYQGQGEALIGWLDAFWDSKGIVTPEKFREHYNETVPLLRIEKFIWTNNEALKGDIQLSHFGNASLNKQPIVLSVTDEEGTELFTKEYMLEQAAVGTLSDIGGFEFALDNIEKAQKINIALKLPGTEFNNEWSVWVFPNVLPQQDESDIVIADMLNPSVLKQLKEGKKVILMASNLGNEENSVKHNFYPLYWSLTFFPGQGKTSIGTLFKDSHPAFDHFPTSYHSDWQWQVFDNDAKAFILNDMPADYKPIAQAVDDFHRNNKEGVIFEFKVGKGKLLVCGFNVETNKSPVARQLRYSLLEYVKSDKFAPVQEVDEAYIIKLLPSIPAAQTADASGEFKNVILKVNAADNVKVLDTDTPWNTDTDKVEIKADKVSYNVKADGSWKDKDGSAWFGSKISINIDCPDGIPGSFYVLFDDWNKKGREGIIEFEGRKVRLERHSTDGGKWVKFHVMREDSNDGKLRLNATMTKGGNLMIREIVLEKE